MKIKLLKYDINLQFSPGKEMHIADLLSRSFIKENVQDDDELDEIVHLIEKHLLISPEKRLQFEAETKKDRVLQTIIDYYKQGWPKSSKKVAEPVRAYWPHQGSISLENGLLFLDERLIVPQTLVSDMLKLLHSSHMGMTKTKLRAKYNLYWPNMNKDIEVFISKCNVCEKYRNKNCKEPMTPHEIPNRPFAKIASDICEYGGKSYIVVVDYFSLWIDAIQISNKTSDSVIKSLKTVFSTHGIPDELIADNMPYASYAVRAFANDWGFTITTSSPHYPKSNGLAEKAVGIVKNMLKKSDDFSYCLLEYRNIPTAATGLTPSQILMGRVLKTKLPVLSSMLIPKEYDNRKIREKIELKRSLDKQYYDRTAKTRPDFIEGENVTVRRDKEWIPAKIEKKCSSPKSYIVRDKNNQLLRRNSLFLRKSLNEPVFVSSQDFDTEMLKDTNVQTKLYNAKEDQIVSPNVRMSKRNITIPVRFKDYELYTLSKEGRCCRSW